MSNLDSETPVGVVFQLGSSAGNCLVLQYRDGQYTGGWGPNETIYAKPGDTLVFQKLAWWHEPQCMEFGPLVVWHNWFPGRQRPPILLAEGGIHCADESWNMDGSKGPLNPVWKTYTVQIGDWNRYPYRDELDRNECEDDCWSKLARLLGGLGYVNHRGLANVDFVQGTLAELGLTYRSKNHAAGAASLGWGWQMPAYQRVEEKPNGDLVWWNGAGSFERWLAAGSGYVPAFANNRIEANRLPEGGHRLVFPDNSRCDFDGQDNRGRLLRRVDRNGNTLTYQYEPGSDGHLASVHDGLGRSVFFIHREDGQPVRFRIEAGGQPKDHVLDYYEDGPAKDRLRCVTTPGGERTRFTYDGQGRLRHIIDSRDFVHVEFTYYQGGEYDGRVHTETFDLDPTTGQGQRRNTYTYDFSKGEASILSEDLTEHGRSAPDQGRRTAAVRYNERLQVTEVTDHLGNTTRIEYGDSTDPYLVTRIVDPNLNPTVFEYNAQRNRTRTRDALGNVTEVKYAEDLFGEATPPLHRNLPYEIHRPPVTVVEGGVEVLKQFAPTRLRYDERGNLEAMVDPRGNSVRVERASDGQVTAVTDRLEHTTRFAYNERGNLATVTTPGTPGETLPLTTRFEYHPEHFDRLLRTVAPGERPQKFEFDLDERLVALTEARGNTLRFSYRDGQLASVVAPPNHGSANQERLTEYRYDVAGRLQEVLADVDRFQQGQGRVRYAYDGFDQLRAMARTMNGAQKTTRYSYDALGRPIQTVDPLGRASSTAYALYCKEFTHTSAAGRVNTFHFDALCRPTETSNREGTTRFEHDEWGRLVRVTQPGGSGALYGKGVRGRARYGDGDDLPETRRYDYDELDRLVRITFPDGKFQSYAYDAEGRLTELTDVHGRRTDYTYHDDNRLRTVSQEGQLFRYEYGPDGRLQTLHYPASTQVRADYGWDAAGNLELLHYKRGGVTLHRMEYKYDASGNRSHFIDTPMDQRQRTVYEYHYDRLDRLTRVYKDQLLVSAYGFDESDNRAWMDKWLDGALRRYDYVYDDADQIGGIKRDDVATFEFAHDRDGNMTLKRDLVTGRSDVYTWNETGCLDIVSVSKTGQPEKLTKYAYDAGNIRKRKASPEGAKFNYYYSGLPILSESKTTDTEELTSFLVGHQVLGYAMREACYWFITDVLGSINGVMNDSGDLLAVYVYDEYGGKHGGMSPDNDATRSGYALQIHEQDDISLNYAWMRYYDPVIGAFISNDRIASVNRYSYAANNPTTFFDPSGLITDEALSFRDGESHVRDIGGFPMLDALQVMGSDPAALAWFVLGLAMMAFPLDGPSGDTLAFANCSGRIATSLSTSQKLGAGAATLGVAMSVNNPGQGSGNAVGPGNPWRNAPENLLDARPQWAIGTPERFIGWLRNIENVLRSSRLHLTQSRADMLVREARSYNMPIRLDPPHPGTAWDWPHLNIGRANVHIAVPQGYMLPP